MSSLIYHPCARYRVKMELSLRAHNTYNKIDAIDHHDSLPGGRNDVTKVFHIT